MNTHDFSISINGFVSECSDQDFDGKDGKVFISIRLNWEQCCSRWLF
jgi:hypothetical protein